MKLTTILALAGAAVASAQVTCTTSEKSPDYDDCKEAFLTLPPKNQVGPGPVACPAIYASSWKYAQVGSCVIEGYSSVGTAACLDIAKVAKGAEDILNSCESFGRIEGQSQFGTGSDAKGVFEGVRFVAA